MRVVIQRVDNAKVIVDNKIVSEIGKGLLIFVGIEEKDNDEDIEWLAKKIVNLRIFEDENRLMNKSLIDVNGEILLVSQFTLHASTKKGNRPSFIKAAKPEIAISIYEKFKRVLALYSSREIKCGIFGEYMKVELVNNGPVTIFVDTKNKE